MPFCCNDMEFTRPSPKMPLSRVAKSESEWRGDVVPGPNAAPSVLSPMAKLTYDVAFSSIVVLARCRRSSSTFSSSASRPWSRLPEKRTETIADRRWVLIDHWLPRSPLGLVRNGCLRTMWDWRFVDPRRTRGRQDAHGTVHLGGVRLGQRLAAHNSKHALPLTDFA